MKEIPLTRGFVAIVDDEDYEWINSFKWRVLPSGNIIYASRTVGKKPKINIMMHRLIMNIEDSSIFVDHRDGNGLNNQKYNLRKATRNDNMRNLTKDRINNSSGYRGVSFDKESGKWLSYIYIDGKQKKLGRFLIKEDAAKAFNAAAKEYFGEFCGKLNFE